MTRLRVQEAAQERASALGKEQAGKTHAPVGGNSARSAVGSIAVQADVSAPAQVEIALPAAFSAAQALIPLTVESIPAVPVAANKQLGREPAVAGLWSQDASAATTPLPSAVSAPAHAAPDRQPANAQATRAPANTGVAEPNLSSREEEPQRVLPSVEGTSSRAVAGSESPAVSSAAPASSGRKAEADAAAQSSASVSIGKGELAAPSSAVEVAQQAAPEMSISPAAEIAAQSDAGRAAAHLTEPPGHEVGKGMAVPAANRLNEGQSQARAAESGQTVLASDLAGVPGALGTLHPESSHAVSAVSVHDAFAALDAQSSPAPATWTHAGARQAEAGFQDPALGWVSVRAGVEGGGIHASLVPASADAAQALGGHLAGLSTHLASQHMPVETMTMAAPEGRGMDAGMDRGGSQQMQQGGGRDSQPGQQAGMAASTEAANAAPGAISPLNDLGPMTLAAMPDGAHISVMA